MCVCAYKKQIQKEREVFGSKQRDSDIVNNIYVYNNKMKKIQV